MPPPQQRPSPWLPRLAPPRGAPGGPVQLGTPRASPGQRDPSHGLSCSSEPSRLQRALADRSAFDQVGAELTAQLLAGGCALERVLSQRCWQVLAAVEGGVGARLSLREAVEGELRAAVPRLVPRASSAYGYSLQCLRLPPPVPTATASSAYGCSLQCLRLPPPVPTATASSAYGYRLQYTRLQPPVPTAAASSTHGCSLW